jgi:acyl-coenzyme A thioesterase PaaI-like protein
LDEIEWVNSFILRAPEAVTMLSDDDVKWLETPAPGWSPVRLPHMILEDSFVSGDSSGGRLSLRYFRHDPDRSLRAKVRFGPGTQGPPGHAHGGSIAAVLDEAMGGAAWMQGHPAVAAELTTRFRIMLPLGARCVVEAWVSGVDGRKVRVAGRLVRSEGDTVYAEGEALFIALDPKKFGVMASEASRIFSELDEGTS